MTKRDINTVHFTHFIFPHSISGGTGEKLDELQTHLKIFEFLRIKMNNGSDGDDIVAAEVLWKALLQECEVPDGDFRKDI